MNWMVNAGWIGAGLVTGFALMLFFYLSRRSAWQVAARHRIERIDELKALVAERDRHLDTLRRELFEWEKRHAVLETRLATERAAVADARAQLDALNTKLPDALRAASVNALRENSHTFLDLAGTAFQKYLTQAAGELDRRHLKIGETLAPVREALTRYGQEIQAIERERQSAYGQLREQVSALAGSQKQLQAETGRLVNALRRPQVRGRWGEITLKRVVELAGMQAQCDFFEQTTVTDADGSRQRPDMVIRLPEGRQVIVDAKVSLAAYLDALECDDEAARDACIDRHARQIQSHIGDLARKSYWAQFETTPEFVVLFIPGEHFFSSALIRQPRLIEDAAEKGVILATPTTLIALLKTVALGWRQSAMAENAARISALGRTLHERLTTLNRHLAVLGRDIDRAGASYNRLLGSYERRVLASARQFSDFGVSDADSDGLTAPDPTANRPRMPIENTAANDRDG